MLIHASSVAINHRAVLMTGAPGLGKSDLALRLIDGGAELIADDQTFLQRRDGRLFASPPDSIRGLFEIRHIGLFRLPFTAAAEVALHIDLAADESDIERLPDKTYTSFLDIQVRHLRLPAFAASTPAKIRACLRYPQAS